MDIINKPKSFTEVKKFIAENSMIFRDNYRDLPNLYMVASNYNLEDKNFMSKKKYKYNGIIMEKETNKVVCYGPDISYKSEYLLNIPINLEEEYYYSESIDGTMVKLWYYQNEWRTSTNKCMDGRRAFWGSSRSFDAIFREYADINFDELDKNKTYTYIIAEEEIKHIVTYSNPVIQLISIRDNTTLYEEFINNSEKRLNKTLDELYQELETYNYNSSRGIIIYKKSTSTFSGFRVCMDSRNYTYASVIRGNTKELRMRYLELYGKDNNLLRQFINMYGENKQLFNDIKTELNNVSKIITDLHEDIFVNKKTNIKYPNKYKSIFFELGKYKRNLQINKKPQLNVTSNLVFGKIIKMPAYKISQILGWNYRVETVTKVKTPEVKVETPEVKVETPEVKVETPEVKVETPEVKVKELTELMESVEIIVN